MTRTCILILGLLAIPLWCEAQEAKNASADFHSYVSDPTSNVELPKHVIAPSGQLSIFADYERADASGTPLYVVNRSEQVVNFHAQDGDIYLKLEYQQPDGTWQRAQGHTGSWCAHSYGFRAISPGQHFTLRGYHVRKDTSAKVRYASYGTVEAFSNVGSGFYSQADLEATERDLFSMDGIPSVLIQYLRAPEMENNLLAEGWAYQETRILASLELTRVLGGTSFLKRPIERVITQLSTQPVLAEDDAQIVAALKSLLARPWEQEMDQQNLLNYCYEALNTPDSQPESYGSPRGLSNFLWETLADLDNPVNAVYPKRKLTDPASWKPVLELVSTRILSAPEEDQNHMVRILTRRSSLVDEWLADSVFESFLMSSNELVVSTAASTLSKRGRWKQLVETGEKASAEAQLVILEHLVKGGSEFQRRGFDGYGGFRSPEPESKEALFWQHCMRSQPEKCAQMWQRLFEESDRYHLPYTPYLKKQVLAYLTNVADQSDKEAKEFLIEPSANASSLVEFVTPDTDELPPLFEEGQLDVVPLFNRLLKHKGYRLDASDNKRLFPFRYAAAKSLKKLRKPVPEGILPESGEPSGSAKNEVDPFSQAR